MAKTMATPRFAGAIHRRQHRFLLRMHVPLCRGKVAVAGEIGERIWVHVGAQRVRQVCRSVYRVKGSILARATALWCCFLRLDFSMWPLRVGAGNPHPSASVRRRMEQGGSTLRQRNASARVLGLPKRDVESTVPHVLPAESEGFFRPQCAVQQHRCDVSQ
jgi:hypothetical protein